MVAISPLGPTPAGPRGPQRGRDERAVVFHATEERSHIHTTQLPVGAARISQILLDLEELTFIDAAGLVLSPPSIAR